MEFKTCISFLYIYKLNRNNTIASHPQERLFYSTPDPNKEAASDETACLLIYSHLSKIPEQMGSDLNCLIQLGTRKTQGMQSRDKEVGRSTKCWCGSGDGSGGGRFLFRNYESETTFTKMKGDYMGGGGAREKKKKVTTYTPLISIPMRFALAKLKIFFLL